MIIHSGGFFINRFTMLEKYDIILASQSPRRQELLKGLDIQFRTQVIDGIDESYPEGLTAEDIPVYISKQKAEAYKSLLGENTLIITADTIVWSEGQVLGKPKDEAEAFAMINQLSGKTHQVITGVCILTKDEERVFSTNTDVSFSKLTDEEIRYYVEKYRPMDKAGAYGIQEWIGYIGVEHINGSYFNVMGLPVQRLYKELRQLD